MGLTEDFIWGLTSMANTISSQVNLTKKQLERLMGKIAFAAQVLPRARLEGHELAPWMQWFAKKEPYAQLQVDRIQEALMFWMDPRNLKEQSHCRPPPPTLTIWTDASEKAYGAISSEDQTTQGLWTPAEEALHINVKELMAISRAVQSKLVARGTSLIVATDNTTTMYTL